MEIATIIGIIASFSLVVLAIVSGGGLAWFADCPSLMIVLCGTTGATLIRYRLRGLLDGIKVAKNACFGKEYKVDEMIKVMAGMAKVARREGMLALQDMKKQIRDPFFVKAVNMLVDGTEPEDMATILGNEATVIAERQGLGAYMFRRMGDFALATGMLWTIIGLGQMLMKMNGPPPIGPSLATALVATFYGVVFSQLIFHPLAGKVRMRRAEKLIVMQLIIRGVLSIQGGETPGTVEERLNSFAAPIKRGSHFSNDGEI